MIKTCSNDWCILTFETFGRRTLCDPCRDYKECAVETCSTLVERDAKGNLASKYCPAHSARDQRGSDMNAPIREPNAPAGSGYINVHGYQVFTINGVKTLEHRTIMEEMIGRPLESWETVHHINGIRNDNRPDNLELWVSRHPKGQRVEDIVSWAKEMLTKYEPESLVETFKKVI